MSLVGIKRAYEQFFMDNYTATPIHWAGLSWDDVNTPEWVYFEYKAREVNDVGLDNSEYAHNGEIFLCVVAESRIRVMDIADTCIELFKGKKILDTTVLGSRIGVQSVFEGTHKSFMEIMITVRTV